MSANGISHQVLKRDRQDAKLAYSQAKRKGRVITEGGGTWSDDATDNAAAPWYRPLNTLDATLLPTLYNATDNAGALVDNPNIGGLVAGRPWT